MRLDWSVGGTATTYTTQYAYDSAGNRKTVTDARSNSTSYTFDEMGRVITVTQPGSPSYSTSYYFNERGQLKQTTNPNSSYVTNTYNAIGNRTKVRVNHDSTYDDTNYTFDDNGNVSQVDFADGGRQNYYYDEVNRLYKTVVKIDASNNATTYQTYNANSKMTKSWDALTKATVYAYDNNSRLTSVTDPNSDATSFTYNKNGATATVTRPNSLVITNNYDKANRISSVVHSPTSSSSDDITVSYTYDANGQVTQITDGLSNNWTKAYDALLRNTTITTPSVGGTSYTLTKEYDGNGNITKVTDFKSNANVGAVREPPDRAHRDAPLRPDVHNQRTGIMYPDSSTVSYTWNCCRITGVTDAIGSSTLAYDQLSRLLSPMI